MGISYICAGLQVEKCVTIPCVIVSLQKSGSHKINTVKLRSISLPLSIHSHMCVTSDIKKSQRGQLNSKHSMGVGRLNGVLKCTI